MRRTTVLVPVALVLCSFQLVAQTHRGSSPTMSDRGRMKSSGSIVQAASDVDVHEPIKRPGHYSAKDWRLLVDSLWGPGVPTEMKLSVFDRFWNDVDQAWGGFPNLVVNWDSLRAVYRPQVEAGVSRGRFAGILSRLTRELLEWHVGAMDRGIDSTLGLFPDLENFPVGYPNYESFRYRPGVPVLNINILFWRTNFGAGLTLLQDGSIMVYDVMPNHPLSLQPGDIILGYDGIPWRQLVKELFEAELPILSSDLVGNWIGSTIDAADHQTMISAGMNWGLFDTIDVLTYSTMDTVHYPTSLLSSIAPPYLIATEQMPVDGVPFPDLDHNKLLSWGVVEGTSIGYIYGWDWSGSPWRETEGLFTQAVDDLLHQHHVDGLILDFRTNPGGWPEFANGGFAQLFNFDPTSNYSRAIRVRGFDRYAFTIQPPLSQQTFTPGPQLYDHPIAVLTGPLSGSSGDYNAFRLRFHPMVRFFGKPTCGGYTDITNQTPYGTITGPYFYRIDDASIYSNVNDEGYMIHKTFPVDEEVWLTQEGVVRGEDDVVKRALKWITTLTYAHDVAIDRTYGRPGIDSVCVTARLTNPLNHTAALSAIITDAAGAVRDSVRMFDDGVHGDNGPGDSVWACLIRLPLSEAVYKVAIRTDDMTQGSFRRLPNVATFTTAGPLTLDSVVVTKRFASYTLRPYLRNKGTSFTVRGARVRLSCSDPWVKTISANLLSLPDLAPGEVKGTSEVIGVAVDTTWPGYWSLRAEVSVDGVVYWTDSTRAVLTGVEERKVLPAAYALEQNYPNPFNPSTTIKFELPRSSEVKLSVYDMLGREVSVLVNERREAGVHEVKCDGSNLASGVYYYRLQAGHFVQSRTLVLLK